MSEAPKYLTREQECALVRSGDLDTLVVRHLPLAHGAAQKYATIGTDLYDDVVQQGCLGLMRAAEKFDPDRGFRFLTYARPWVNVMIQNYLSATKRMVRIGTTNPQRFAMGAFRKANATHPDDFVALGMSRDEADRFWALISVADERTEHTGPDGIDYEWLASDDPNTEDRYAELEHAAAVRAVVARAFARLTPFEREVVELRWMADEPQSRPTIGRRHGVGQEAVRLAEARLRAKFAKALSALREAA